MAQEQIFSMTEFHGLGDPFRFGIDSTVTRTMENISPRYGRLLPRDGYTLLGLVQTGDIIGLFEYQLHNLNSHLVRVDTDDFFIWDPVTVAWVSKKGAVTMGQDASTDFADFAVYNNFCYVITPNEKLLKFDGDGVGANIVQNANSPAASVIEAFEGFLFLGNVDSDNTGVNKDGNRLRYESTNVDGTWDTLKTIVINQTPGMILRLKTFGRVLFVYKNDGVVAVRFIGGTTVFQIDNLNSGVGILAPLSIGNVPGLGQIFLATDRRLYLNSGQIQQLKAIVNNTIAEDFNVAWLSNAVASVDVSNNIYHLFYASGSNQFLNKRLDFNYVTGEFNIHDYPTGQFTRAAYANIENQSANKTLKELVAAQTDKKTYRVDIGTTDNSAVIDSNWNSDWQDFGFPGEKYLSRVDVTLKEDPRSVIEIATRADFEREYQQSREYGISSMKTDGDITVSHRIRPTLGKWHDLRLRFRPASTPSNIELKRIDWFYTSVRQGGQRDTPANIIGQ